MTVVVARVVVVVVTGVFGLALDPASGGVVPWPLWVLSGVGLGGLIVLLEWGLGHLSIERLVWGAVGGVAGLLAGLGVGMALAPFVPRAGAFRGLLAFLFAYVGASALLRKTGDLEGLSAKLFPKTVARRETYKVLDTSVIIEGRIADICETGFLEGILVVPQFVLREVQQIADSSDSLKRARGKRGFDVLQRIQRIPKVKVQIHDLDFPDIREVDRKLIEMAKVLGGKVVTNDYNLNKVAELSGVPVLNINELANALKPVVLPGELMHVYVLKEGKEAGQGVAYLDDGTMVVVDHGKKYLGQSVDVLVTSVLQTTAGRMIFGRPREEEMVSGGRG